MSEKDETQPDASVIRPGKTQGDLERALHGALHPNDAAKIVAIAQKSTGAGGFRARVVERLPKFIGTKILDDATRHFYPDWKPKEDAAPAEPPAPAPGESKVGATAAKKDADDKARAARS